MGTIKEFRVMDPAELEDVARSLIDAFPNQRVFAFFGPMGVGKTTFIQAICRVLEATDQASSPTFSIVNHYMTSAGDSLYHFDFYRINSMEEAFDLGYEDYFYSGNYCFIEWPEKVETLLPDDCLAVNMQDDHGKRIIRIGKSPAGVF
ncbi:MAG: tRNA (adenosine(37)-N6)-threonylcarbamoyltransferase complex ATPase subunit type 1 TsaE [Bacteroidales bacterium]